MTPLAQRLLEVDVAVLALANALGRTERARAVRDRLRDLRIASGRALLAELATHATDMDPQAAVRSVIDAAIGAGLGWHDLVAIVNQASERRAS